MEGFSVENVAIILFFIGLTGIIIRRNMMIVVIGMSIMDAAIILFFININNTALDNLAMAEYYLAKLVDPVPHALMITSVVIGVAVKAIILIMIIDYYNKNKTIDFDEARALREEELTTSALEPSIY